jgi:hypothetical protein
MPRGTMDVTEREWLACTDVDWLLIYLCRQPESLDARKLRLFVCACCRRLWPYLTDQRIRAAVEAAEAFADGKIGSTRLANARRGALKACTWTDTANAIRAATYAGEVPFVHTVREGVRACAEAMVEATRQVQTWGAERTAQAALLHDVFGNPSRQPRIDPAWFGHNDGVVGRLAPAIYEQHRFDDLPVLADALEEAGCSDADLLGHCRSGRPHARGCWALDLVIAKK